MGNFDHVIHEACDRAYLPFLRLMLDYPAVRLGLHTSGCLLEWLEQNRGEYFELVRELLSRGQLELLGGGMYEPILPVIPLQDAYMQLAWLQQYLQEHFGVLPSGMWTPERVWEPQMAQIAGMYYRYTLLDDFHFEGNVLPAQLGTEYFETEHEGQGLKLLPISQKLRYTMPFREVHESFDFLRETMSGAESSPLVVFGDDGEKFGVWPDTYNWVYERGWLRDFFAALTENAGWLRLSLPGEVIEQRAPAGRVYIPCRSYREMGEWTRVDPEAAEDGAPGHWRNFLVKYPEVADLRRRIQNLSARISYAAPSLGQERLAAASRALYRAECNCAWWHGVFGGVYLNYLRAALSRELLEAEQEYYSACSGALLETPERRAKRQLDELLAEGRGKEAPGGTAPASLLGNLSAALPSTPTVGIYAPLPMLDPRLRGFDDAYSDLAGRFDGAAEEAMRAQGLAGSSDFMLELPGHLAAWVDAAHGLCLRRLDYYPSRFCWTDVLARRREHYHHKVEHAGLEDAGEHESIHDRVVLKEEGLASRLVVDPQQRVSFTTYFSTVPAADWFMALPAAGTTVDFSSRDFQQAAEAALEPGGAAPALSVVLARQGYSLRKRIALSEAGLELSVELVEGQPPLDSGLFWVEFNFTVLTDSATDRWLELNGQREGLNAALERDGLRSLRLVDEWQGAALSLELAKAARLLSYPVYTVSSSEGGFERTYQGSCFMLGYPPAALRGGIMLSLGVAPLPGRD